MAEIPFAELWTELDLTPSTELKPSESWTAEAWAWHQRTERLTRFLAFWAYHEFVQALGWAEHTSDWDWWMHITLLDNTEEQWGCGTYFGPVTDQTGKKWRWANELLHEAGLHSRESYTVAGKVYEPIMPVTITIDGFREDPDEAYDDPNYVGPDEEVAEYVIMEIKKIVVGYDT